MHKDSSSVAYFNVVAVVILHLTKKMFYSKYLKSIIRLRPAYHLAWWKDPPYSMKQQQTSFLYSIVYKKPCTILLRVLGTERHRTFRRLKNYKGSLNKIKNKNNFLKSYPSIQKIEHFAASFMTRQNHITFRFFGIPNISSH